MLLRRIFQQLTDSILLGPRQGLACFCKPGPKCFSATPSRSREPAQQVRCASSSSSTRWKSRQTKDRFAREAKVQGLKSRAAYKLLEINEKYKLFKKGNTVVDLGYAPGSWSQVAVSLTAPNGRVVGIDIIPAQPPKGASTIQGNFLSPAVQAEVRAYVQDPMRGRPRRKAVLSASDTGGEAEDMTEEDLEEQGRGYVDMERRADLDTREHSEGPDKVETVEQRSVGLEGKRLSQRQRDEMEGRVVDVVLSDMSAPWDQTTGFWQRSVSDPYLRMMNTSGMAFRDHAGSMDLCMAALTFCYDTLRTGGHLVCKFYQGSEDKALEIKLRMLFEKVYREKPESSRSESKEAYFVALRRKEAPAREDVFKD